MMTTATPLQHNQDNNQDETSPTGALTQPHHKLETPMPQPLYIALPKSHEEDIDQKKTRRNTISKSGRQSPLNLRD